MTTLLLNVEVAIVEFKQDISKAKDDIKEQETLDKQKYKCEICKKNYSGALVLQTHIKRVHERIKNVKCQQCEKTFYENNELKRHTERVHNNSDTKRNFELQNVVNCF